MENGQIVMVEASTYASWEREREQEKKENEMREKRKKEEILG